MRGWLGGTTIAAVLAAAAVLAVVAVLAAVTGRAERFELDACADVCTGCDSCAPAPAPALAPAARRGYAGYAGLPPPATHDVRHCSSAFQGDPSADGACFALVHHHCVKGLQDDAKVPALVRGFKTAALNQLYSAAQGWSHTSGGRTKRVFNHVPKRWTSVCAARPETAGVGQCAHVTPYEWRMSAFGHNDASRQGQCGAGLYVKSKFRGSKITSQMAKDTMA